MILYYTFVRIRTRGKGAVAAAAVVDVVADSSSYHTYQVSIYAATPAVGVPDVACETSRGIGMKISFVIEQSINAKRTRSTFLWPTMCD